MLFNITELGVMPGFEMREVCLFDTVLAELTYPQIMQAVFKKLSGML